MNANQQLVDSLDSLSLASLSTNMLQVRTEALQQFLVSFEDFVFASSHQSQSTSLSAGSTAANGAVDHLDILFSCHLGQSLCLVHSDGAQVDDDAAVHGLQQAAHNAAALRIGINHHQNSVHLLAQLLQSSSAFSTLLHQISISFGTDVKQNHRETLGHDIFSNAVAHGTQTDHTNFLHCLYLRIIHNRRSRDRSCDHSGPDHTFP